jgi:hypothetical protein
MLKTMVRGRMCQPQFKITDAVLRSRPRLTEVGRVHTKFTPLPWRFNMKFPPTPQGVGKVTPVQCGIILSGEFRTGAIAGYY